MRTRKIILGDYCCDARSAVMVIYSYIKEIEDRMHIKRSKKGFTLAELLIVVAIIGVLVAISIPIFSGQLEKAREATDAANIRSQYAEVLTDAMMGGSVNKNHTDYAPVQLRQQKDEWQSDGLKASLEGVFGKVAGTGPKAAGQAWVEFDAAKDVAVLHYDDGSGSSGSGSAGSGEEGGGGTVAPTPTNPTKPIEPTSPTEQETTPTKSTEPETQAPTEPETEETKEENTSGVTPSGTSPFGGLAYDWNQDIKKQSQYTIEPHKVYIWNGNIYIGNRSEHMDQWRLDNFNPDNCADYYYITKYTGKTIDISVFTSANQDIKTPVTRGDVCQVGNDYYIFKDGGNASNGPLKESNRWMKIDKEI